MAAKQGLTAQLSQAGEDAKRAVLSRTGVTASSWFSNLNTVCTIKSAPPRTPEVLQMLATKSGWLFKRNEQHVWQARWCCVVPHTFLYYFDANIVPGQAPPLPAPSAAQQEEWNAAILRNKNRKKQHEKRSTFSLFPGGSHPNHNTDQPNGGAAPLPEVPPEVEGTSTDPSKFTTLQPAGIIDLECYTAVHRSSDDHTALHNGPVVMELAGDDQVNPDLRGFYFTGLSEEDAQDWTSALLQGRHAALQDECDAYKQVCEGFALQLQVLHSQLDTSTLKQEESTEELYRVRSHAEDVRRSCWRLVEDCLERKLQSDCTVLHNRRNELRRNMDAVRSHDYGVAAATRLLADYTQTLEDALCQAVTDNTRLQADLETTGQSDQARAQQLQIELEETRQQQEQEKASWQSQVTQLQQLLAAANKELQDTKKDLDSTRMQATMYQSQQLKKLQEHAQHKKILKREVLELRQKLQEQESLQSSLRHEQESAKLKWQQEQTKADLLERYVKKVESQVAVQQNMMELMSQSGSVVYHSANGGNGSVYGGGNGGSVYGGGGSVRAQEDDDDDDDIDDDEEDVAPDQVPERLLPQQHSHRRLRRQQSHNDNDVDNKSHLSELTEDRTQRHFEAILTSNAAAYGHVAAASSPYLAAATTPPPERQARPSRRKQQQQSRALQQHQQQAVALSPHGPPPFIIGVNTNKNSTNKNSKMLHTISGSSSSVPPGMPQTPPPSSSRSRTVGGHARDAGSVVSSEPRLSVAQRARLEADRTSTPVRIRLDESLTGASVHSKSSKSRSQQQSQQNPPNGGLWRRMEQAVLGQDDDDESLSTDSSSVRSTRVTDYTEDSGRQRDLKEEKKSTDSTVSVSNLSLQERSELQRSKQVQFLKEQGLIRDDTDVKGGAMLTADTGSVTSTHVSQQSRGSRRNTP